MPKQSTNKKKKFCVNIARSFSFQNNMDKMQWPSKKIKNPYLLISTFADSKIAADRKHKVPNHLSSFVHIIHLLYHYFVVL